jgi:hypothetical protein
MPHTMLTLLEAGSTESIAVEEAMLQLTEATSTEAITGIELNNLQCYSCTDGLALCSVVWYGACEAGPSRTTWQLCLHIQRCSNMSHTPIQTDAAPVRPQN